jgi:hypothetical protein
LSYTLNPEVLAYLIAAENRHDDEWHAIEAQLEIDGLHLQNLTEEQQNDIDLVFPAVSQNGLALQFASLELRNTIMVARAAIAQKPDAAQYATPNVRAHFAAEAALLELAIHGVIPEPMDQEVHLALENPGSPALSSDGSIYSSDQSDNEG